MIIQALKRVKAEKDIKELRNKLSEKAYQSGILYMKMDEFRLPY